MNAKTWNYHPVRSRRAISEANTLKIVGIGGVFIIRRDAKGSFEYLDLMGPKQIQIQIWPILASLPIRRAIFGLTTPVRRSVEVLSTASNRPDGALLRSTGVIPPCISRILSKERGDMQCAKAAGSLRPRGRHKGSGSTEVSELAHRLTGYVSVVSVAPTRGWRGASRAPDRRWLRNDAAKHEQRITQELPPTVRRRGRTSR